MNARKTMRSAAALAAITLALSASVSETRAQPFGFGRMMGGPMGPMGFGPGMSGRRSMKDEPVSGSRRCRGYSCRSQERAVESSHHSKSQQAATKPASASMLKPGPAHIAASVPAKINSENAQTNTIAAPQAVTTTSVTTTPAPTQQNTPAATVVQPTKTTSTALDGTETESALPARISSETMPHNCLAKQYLKDGTIIFQDFCTLEQAIVRPGENSQMKSQPQASPPPQTQPQPQINAARLARTR